MRVKQNTAVVAAAGLLVAGCFSVDRPEVAGEIATRAGMTALQVNGGAFVLQTFMRLGKPGAPIHVYGEGDGFAWINRSQPSPDPTPTDPTALRLAAADPSPNVVYVARPCQYVRSGGSRRCEEDYWTERRFASEVVESVDEVIGKLKERGGGGLIDLFGFSGGGAVAALTAARRTDVASLRTVAGNLDHVVMNQRAEVSPLIGSLNAADVADKLSAVPQIHFIGGEDNITPSYIAESYKAHARRKDCIAIVPVPGVSHIDGWTERWGSLFKRNFPKC